MLEKFTPFEVTFCQGITLLLILISVEACAPAKPLLNTKIAEKNALIQQEFRGTYCGVTEPQRRVITDGPAWQKLWQQVHDGQSPMPMTPNIDFGKYAAVVVFMGEQRSGGYDIEITAILEMPDKRQIVVRESRPKSGGMVTMALTQPYHIVIVNKSSLPIEFAAEQ